MTLLGKCSFGLFIAGCGICFSSCQAFAAVDSMTHASHFSASLGLGQASAVSAENGKGSATESPFTMGFSVDHYWRDSVFMLVEHLRSYGSGSTSIGLTGFGAKYYPWLSPRVYHPSSGEAIPKSQISADGYMFYVGASTGFSQASVPAANKNSSAVIAVAFYMAGKAGFEMPINRDWSMVSEFDYGFSFLGSGSIQYLSLGAGVSYGL